MKGRDGLRDRIAPEGILYDLPLLLHSIRLKRLSRNRGVAVGAPTNPSRAVQEIAQLSDGATAEVGQGSPALILPGVRHFMGQHRQIIGMAIGKKDVVAQRHGAATT
jgi:hypothetical protein